MINEASSGLPVDKAWPKTVAIKGLTDTLPFTEPRERDSALTLKKILRRGTQQFWI